MQTTPYLIALNQTMQSQTKVCIAKSCEVYAFLRYWHRKEW